MNAANLIKEALPPSLVADQFLSTYFESFFSIDYHVLIRFGKWDTILAIETPTDRKVY
jgi:hypothetical protein